SLDLYISETNKYADYILPVTTFYEREDVPVAAISEMLRPAMWFGPAVIEPRGSARNEWTVLNDLCARMGYGGAYSSSGMRWLAKLGYRITPRQLFDMLLRSSEVGDKFGFNPNGLNLKKLEQAQNGILFHNQSPV